MEAGSAAAYFAGSIVLRKTFEAVAQRSLSSIFSSLHSRFRGQDQLTNLQRELESRLQVLSLPVDMCIQHVLHGNTALEGALDMVINLINDIVGFQEELEAQTYNESVSKVSQNEAVKRLEGFLSRLDTILPYLALAVNAVSLLRTSHPEISPSRLMEASYLIRNSSENQGVAICISAKVYKFETRLTLPRWQEKMLRCRASLKQSRSVSNNNFSQEFELSIIEEKPSDEESIFVFSVDKITAIGSSTLHVLGLGEHNLEAVLLIDLDSSKKSVHYALQCIDDDGDETKSDANSSGEDDEKSSLDDTHTVGSVSRISKLGLLEYALRLCMLQSREERDHWCIPDERIHMFFSDPRYVSEPVANVQKKCTQKATEIVRLTPNEKKKPNDFETQTPPRRRPSITDLFYDLRVDSPSKIIKD